MTWFPWKAMPGPNGFVGTPQAQLPVSVQPGGGHVSKYSSRYVVQFITGVPVQTPPQMSPFVHELKSVHELPSGAGDGTQLAMLSQVPSSHCAMPSKHWPPGGTGAPKHTPVFGSHSPFSQPCVKAEQSFGLPPMQ